jgi:MinD superfamily P-loop ATPase
VPQPDKSQRQAAAETVYWQCKLLVDGCEILFTGDMDMAEDGSIRPVPWIDPDRCDGCGLCLRVCPCGALELQGDKVVARPEVCDYSGLCEMICPRQAIQRPFEIVSVEKPSAGKE